MTNAHRTATLPLVQACFGLGWEAIPGGDPICGGCADKDACFREFARTTVPKARAERPDMTLEALAKEMGVKAPALLIALDYVHPTTQNQTKEKPVAKKTAPPTAKAKAKPKAVKKTVVIVENPLETGPAQSASGPVTKETQNAPPATARVWGKHTFAQRWDRERKRNAAIGALTPGCRLTRKFKGKTYAAVVKAESYEMAGTEYPTLQALTDAIAGVKEYPKQIQKREDGTMYRPEGTRKMSNWSAVRFWKIALNQAAKRR